MTVIYNIEGKRLGTLLVTSEESWELQDYAEFLSATPVDGPVPDGFVGLLPLIRDFYTWVVIRPTD